jgi:hypothetical protein
VWIPENVDPTPWAGKTITLRFKYVGDSGVTGRVGTHPGHGEILPIDVQQSLVVRPRTSTPDRLARHEGRLRSDRR